MPALSAADFDAEALAAGRLVLVDFWAPWCVPCAKIAPAVEQLGRDHAGALHVFALDVDAHPAPAARHDVLSLPTIILFRDGSEIARLTGSASAKKLIRLVEPHLESQ